MAIASIACTILSLRYYSYLVPSPCRLYQKRIVLDHYMEGFHEIHWSKGNLLANQLEIMGVIHLIHLQGPALMLIVPLLKTRYHHHYNRVFYEPCTSCRIQSRYNEDSFFDLVSDAWLVVAPWHATQHPRYAHAHSGNRVVHGCISVTCITCDAFEFGGTQLALAASQLFSLDVNRSD